MALIKKSEFSGSEPLGKLNLEGIVWISVLNFRYPVRNMRSERFIRCKTATDIFIDNSTVVTEVLVFTEFTS
jgi:hypothetical protein